MKQQLHTGHKKPATVIVVGGGAAGIIASTTASINGARTVLVEKKDRLGMKILISGGGKCNLTHDGDMQSLAAQFRRNESLFLKPAFYSFTNKDFLKLLHDRGMHTYVRPDGRVFPVDPSDAKDVVSLLSDYVNECRVSVTTDNAVTRLLVQDGRAVGVETQTGSIFADCVIVSVGGSSYPATGTTGDGWRWLDHIGHTIVPIRAALAPIYLDEGRPEWSGIAIRDAIMCVRMGDAGKEIVKWRGDVLFTHKGLSGPSALAVSRNAAELLSLNSSNRPIVELDLSPDEPFEQLHARLSNEVRANPRKLVSALASPFVPARLVMPLVKSANIEPDTLCAYITSKGLKSLVSQIKRWNLGPVRAVPLERGEVVAGGVSLEEVDSQTMQSKLYPNLYLCGEVLDIAGPVGGYNLQAAWSTGYVAGLSAARSH